MALLDEQTLEVDGRQAALPRAAGLYDIETRLEDGRRARFSLSLPAGFDDASPRPLVVVLHYGGQPTRYYGRPLIEHLFGPALAPLEAVQVAPETLGGQWTEAANEAFVMRLVEALEAAYAIDADRLVIGGYSMGAIGTWHFIENYPERFSAALPVAGLPAAEVTAPVPVYTLATQRDEIFEFARFEGLVSELQARGRPVEFEQVDARGHYDVGGFAQALGAAVPWLERTWRAIEN